MKKLLFIVLLSAITLVSVPLNGFSEGYSPPENSISKTEKKCPALNSSIITSEFSQNYDFSNPLNIAIVSDDDVGWGVEKNYTTLLKIEGIEPNIESHTNFIPAPIMQYYRKLPDVIKTDPGIKKFKDDYKKRKVFSGILKLPPRPGWEKLV